MAGAANLWAASRVYFERRLIIIFLMGFASGLPLLLSGATLSIWLTEAGVTLTAIGLFALVGSPYTFKFVWAPLIDRVPLPILSRRLGRRRAWMVMIQLGLMAAIAGLGFSDPAAAPFVTAVLAVGSFGCQSPPEPASVIASGRTFASCCVRRQTSAR